MKRWISICFLSLLMPITAFGQSQWVPDPKPANDGPVETPIFSPQLISWEQLMQLSPAKRHRYLTAIAKAVAAFEASINKRLITTNTAEMRQLNRQVTAMLEWGAEPQQPTFVEWLQNAIIASAEAATTCASGITWPDGTCVVPATGPAVTTNWPDPSTIKPGVFSGVSSVSQLPSIGSSATQAAAPVATQAPAVAPPPAATAQAPAVAPAAATPAPTKAAATPPAPTATACAGTLMPDGSCWVSTPAPPAPATNWPDPSTVKPGVFNGVSGVSQLPSVGSSRVPAATPAAPPTPTAAPPATTKTAAAPPASPKATQPAAPPTASSAPNVQPPAPTTPASCKFKSTQQMNQTLNKARKEYAGNVLHDGKSGSAECSIGGMMSSYGGGAPTAGGCKPITTFGDDSNYCADQSKSATTSTKSRRPAASQYVTLCNPNLYCQQDGSPFCLPVKQNTAMNCSQQAANLNNSSVKCKGDPQAWTKLTQDLPKLCGKPGAKQLFCFECSALEDAVAKAAKEAKVTPAPAPAAAPVPVTAPDLDPTLAPGPVSPACPPTDTNAVSG